jgi:Oxysterol-binding protein
MSQKAAGATGDDGMPTCRHKLANPKGGIQMIDDGGIVPGVVKDMIAKIGNKVMKGEIGDVLKIPTPAFAHVERTYVEGAAADLAWSSKYLTRAAATSDPIERLKLVITSYLAGNHITPSDCQLRAPLNPILGETA